MKKTTLIMAATAISFGVGISSCSKSVKPASTNGNEQLLSTNESGASTLAAAAVAFGMAGFATQNGGTTGGQGGTTVTATTFAQLQTYLQSTTTYIVRVDRRIYNGTKGGRINVNSNKTLLGVGSAGFLDGIGLSISGKRNIIIQNVKLTLTSITDRSDPTVYDPDGDEGRPQIIVNSGDCISISGTSSNIWIDHCELYSIDPAVQTNQDLYDGLIDIKNGSQYATISWCYFHDHHKTHLIGSSDSDNFDRKLTVHHNYYRNINGRLPLNRFGVAHVYNNYFNRILGSGVDSRMGACVRVENNVYETAKSPIIRSGSTIGRYQVLGNIFSGITGTAAPTSSTCTFTPPYSYPLDAASDVKASVTSGAGIGKI
jgi:pectate lyase